MKHFSLKVSVLLLAIACIAFSYPKEKLIEPLKLVEIIQSVTAKKPLILNVGPEAMIPGAQLIGVAEDPTNKEKLKTTLKNIPKNKDIVLYCGCCKLVDCWNIHEADKIASSLGYTNYKILNMPTNFNVDWVDKKYPLQ